MSLEGRRNLHVVAGLIALMGVMTGLVAYSPTLYRIFCSATGYEGSVQRADSDTAAVSNRAVTVRFDTNVAPGIPWRFAPEQESVTVRLGEQKLVFFSAENLSDQPVVGHATYNVTPGRAGAFFKKIQCFCFNEERLEAHQKVDMPVVFFIDPAIAADPTAKDVRTITLSYTFFRSVVPQEGKELSRLSAEARPNPARGRELFVERCGACHSLTQNKMGPALGGVYGRLAGGAAGYHYSDALRQAEFKWSAKTLDSWLAGPQQFIRGARMPVRVPDPIDRRDLIAFLRQESGGGLRPSHASIAQSGPQGSEKP